MSAGPLLLAIFYLLSDADNAVPLSAAAVTGSAMAYAILRWPERHPTADRPLIALDVAMMLEPCALVGTVAGVTINLAVPAWLHAPLIAILLGVLFTQLQIV